MCQSTFLNPESSLFNCTSLYSPVSLIVVAESLIPAVPPFSTLLVSSTHDVSGVLSSSLSCPRSLPLLIFSFLSFCSSRLCVFIYPAPSKLIYGSEGGIPSFPAKKSMVCALSNQSNRSNRGLNPPQPPLRSTAPPRQVPRQTAQQSGPRCYARPPPNLPVASGRKVTYRPLPRGEHPPDQKHRGG